MQDEQETTQPGEDHEEEREVLRCEYCGSDTRRDVVQAAFWSDRGLIAIEHIPARMCEGCGEQFYDEQTTERIEQIVTDPAARASREIVVPVFSLSEAGHPKTAGAGGIDDKNRPPV